MIGEEVVGYEQSNNHLKLNFKSGAVLTVKLSFGPGLHISPHLSIEVAPGPRSPADEADTTRLRDQSQGA